jgi:hypothetical protein
MSRISAKLILVGRPGAISPDLPASQAGTEAPGWHYRRAIDIDSGALEPPDGSTKPVAETRRIVPTCMAAHPGHWGSGSRNLLATCKFVL